MGEVKSVENRGSKWETRGSGTRGISLRSLASNETNNASCLSSYSIETFNSSRGRGKCRRWNRWRFVDDSGYFFVIFELWYILLHHFYFSKIVSSLTITILCSRNAISKVLVYGSRIVDDCVVLEVARFWYLFVEQKPT